MVQEDVGQGRNVSEQCVNGARGEGRKSVIGGGKDGEGARALQGFNQVGRAEGGHQGGETTISNGDFGDDIRGLYGLYRKMALEVFIKTVSRALTYRITDIKTVERIATLQLTAAHFQLPLPQIDRQLEKRDAYIEGYFADEVDLSVYDNITEDDDG